MDNGAHFFFIHAGGDPASQLPTKFWNAEPLIQKHVEGIGLCKIHLNADLC